VGKNKRSRAGSSAFRPGGEAGPEHPLVSVLIGVVSGYEQAVACLKSLAPAIADLDAEVLLLTDGFDGQGVDAPAGASAFKTRAIPGHSVTAPWNRGLREARGRFIALVDAAITPCPDAISGLLKRAQKKSAGIVCGELLFEDGTVSSAGFDFDAEAGFVPRARGEAAGHFALAQDATVAAGDLGMALVSRAALMAAGELDERMSMFYAGVDFSLRVEKAGYRTIYTHVEVGVDRRTTGLFSDPDLLTPEQLLSEVKGLELLCGSWASGSDQWSRRLADYRHGMNTATSEYLASLEVSEPEAVLERVLSFMTAAR
jgi:hypothetical protein